jgi:hypothetical protein
MNIVLINDTGVEVYKSWHHVHKETSFKKIDFAPVGTDFVLNCNNETYEISRDIKTLERVASDRVFAKSKMSGIDLLVVLAAVMSILIYFK